MSKVTWKPGTMLSPLPPVLVSCGTMETPNVLTVAWTGIVCSEPTLTYVSIRPSRYSHEIIKNSKEFVLNLPTWKMVAAVDFCGVKSGKNINKFKETGLTIEACSQVSAPQIAEAPVSLECKVKSVTPYGTHDMFLAEVVAVNVDEQYITDQGELDLEKAGLIAFSHGKYYTLGRNLGSFGFSVNKALLKQKQEMAKVNVVEKKPSPLKKEKSKVEQKPKFKSHALFSRRVSKGQHRKEDIIKDTISRPDKRYDKVKKVKTEYRKTEEFKHIRKKK
jgi:flavin reductase (DIM6/NTAB) family NADH-FMN oxidoreductase RutF